MPRSPLVDHKPGAAKAIPPVDVPSGRNVVSRVSALDGTRLTTDRRDVLRKMYETSEDVKGRPVYMYAVPPWRKGREPQRISLAERVTQAIPSRYGRDSFRVFTHGLAETGVLALKTLDIPSRLFGHERSRLRDWYEKIEAGVARDKFETDNAFFPIASTAVNLASAGIYGKALAPMFGANVGVDTYELAKETGAQEGGALATGTAHGLIDTAIWTLGQGLASRYLPKAWQWLGRELAGAMRGAASSVTSDTVLNSLGADISGEEMTKHAVHAAWMVPVLGMLKMGGKRRAEAMSLLKKARPDLAGMKADKVIETIESEFGDPKSQKVALAWVARKGANLPDDVAQIRQALEVASKVKGLDPMSRSPFEILSDPAYARYLPKPRPQDVKAFSNMKRYPEGVIGFDVSDDAAGRQATREMINAYMSPSSNPWCLATGSGAAKLGELGPNAESYWKQHSAVPKQIFFQEVDGKLELTAFRATSRGGEGRQEYWDTSDAGYSGIPIKVKVPGDPMGRYRKMVFKPKATYSSDADRENQLMDLQIEREQYARDNMDPDGYMTPTDRRYLADLDRRMQELRDVKPADSTTEGEVQGTFEDIAPGRVFKGDPFRDGRSQTWVKTEPKTNSYTIRTEGDIYRLIDRGLLPEARRGDLYRALQNNLSNGEFLTVQGSPVSEGVGDYVLVEDKVRTTENGITKFRTTKYADPTDWVYEPPKPGEQPKPVEIEESELVSPEWMRSRGYDPESESDVRRMQQELSIQAWGNGVEAAMAVVPTKRTYMQTKSGTPETVTYWPNGRAIMAVDFVKDGVPYKEEYDYAGPNWDMESPYDLYPGDSFYQLPRPEYGVSLTTGAVNRRLIRNPGTERAEVLDDVRVDEGLGGFVRTSGNRRWRMGVDGDIDLSGISLIQDALSNHRITRAQADEAYRRYTTPGYGRSVFLNSSTGEFSTLPASADRLRLVVEDHQPDGTWAPAVDRVVNAETGETVELPPPPPAARMNDVPFALKAGRTRRNVRTAEGGGDTPGAPLGAPAPEGSAPAQPGGPRIVLNPAVFHDKRDALCVTFNEAFRVVMEENGFEPVSEPTEKQRKFFADTAYANDELQLRRTILARIATLDTSVSDPTDEQLEETVEMLEMVMEVGAPQNEWEQQAVQRLHDVVAKAREGHVQNEETPPPPQDEASTQADVGGGVTDEDKATAWEAGKRFDMGKGKYFLAGEKEGEGEIRWSADDSVAMGGVTGFKSWSEDGNSHFAYKTDTGSLRGEAYDANGTKLRTASQFLARVDRKANDGHVIKAGEAVAETVQNHPEDNAEGYSTKVTRRDYLAGSEDTDREWSGMTHIQLDAAKLAREWTPGARVDMGPGKYFLAGEDKGTGSIYGADGSVIQANVTNATFGSIRSGGATWLEYTTDTGSRREETWEVYDDGASRRHEIDTGFVGRNGKVLGATHIGRTHSDWSPTFRSVIRSRFVPRSNLAARTVEEDGRIVQAEEYRTNDGTTIDMNTRVDGATLLSSKEYSGESDLPPKSAPSAPQPVAPQPVAPQPAPSITPPAPGKSGNNFTGDAPSIVPDEPTDGVTVGPGGRKTYTDASGRRITKNAWRKLHGLA